MANEKNLIPFSERTESEQREIRSAGGVASGAARRRKRSLREAADLLLSKPVTDGRVKNKILRAGIDEDDIDYQMAIIVGLAGKAAKGDAKAAKTIFDLLGESGESASQDAIEKLDEVLDQIGGVV